MKLKHAEERRQHQRVPLQAEVELFHDGRALGQYRSIDFSQGGVQIRGFPLPMMSRVKVFVQLDTEHDALLLEGTVAWRTIGRSGIQFVDLSQATREALHSFLDEEQQNP